MLSVTLSNCQATVTYCVLNTELWIFLKEYCSTEYSFKETAVSLSTFFIIIIKAFKIESWCLILHNFYVQYVCLSECAGVKVEENLSQCTL